MTARGRARFAAAALAAAAAAVPATGPARAQALPFEAVPFGGVVLPSGRMVDQGAANLAHRSAVTFGGRLDAWLTRSAGLELALSYSLSGYHVTTGAGQVFDTSGALFAATVRFLYRFARTGPVVWHVGAGAGMLAHSGTYFENLGASGRRHLAGVVGLTGRVPVSEGSALEVTAEDYVGSVRLSGIAGITPAAHLNHYPVLSLGVVLPLGARGEDLYDYRVIR